MRPRAARTLTLQALSAARRARREMLVILPLLVGAILVETRRRQWFPDDAQTWIAVTDALIVGALGWWLARDASRLITPWLFRRLDTATAGTLVFLLRLTMLGFLALVVARMLGANARTIAVGGAVFAVVFGLAAQQTLGNVIAGMVLISAQPFRVGDRVRLQAGGLAGMLEGVVASHGLLYTTLAQGEDSIMVPNNVVLNAAVVPLREPAGVDLRARLRPDVKPSDVQRVIETIVRTPVRGEPRIALEEVDGEEVVVRVTATPESEADGSRLADEVLAAIGNLIQPGQTEERRAVHRWNEGRFGVQEGDGREVTDAGEGVGDDRGAAVTEAGRRGAGAGDAGGP